MLANHLIKLGFNQGEAKIYIALLNSGDLTATELAIKTGLGRTNIYNYVKSLGEKNLVSDYERNSKVFFQASDPKELYSMLDIQKKELNNLSLEHLNLLPRFDKLYRQQNKAPKIKMYLGKKDWKKLMKTIYLEQEVKEIFVLVPDLDNYTPPSPVYQSSLYTNKVFTYLLTNHASDMAGFNKRDERKNRKTINLDRNILPIDTETIVFKSSIFSGNFSSNDLQVYSIEDKGMVKIFFSILKNLVTTGTRLNQGV